MKKVRWCLWLAFWSMLGSLGACNKLNPTAPVIEPSAETITPKRSTIQLPLLFSIAELEQFINSKLPDTLYNDQSFENQQDNLKLSVVNIGTISLKMAGDELAYAIPLRVNVAVRTKLNQKLNTSFSLILKMKSKLSMTTNWQLVPKTQLHEIHWIEKPKLKVAFIRINITKTVEKHLREKVPSILPLLDQTLAQKLPIKEEITKIWNGIQKPIRINKHLAPFWLKVKPKQVHLQSISGDTKELMLDLVIESFITLVPSGKRPQVALVPLEKLSHKKISTKGFQIYAFAKLPFVELNRLLKKELKGKSVETQGYKITIKQAKLAGSKGKVFLETKIKGATKGTLHFTGTPMVDSLNMVLSITDFDFDVNTENLLVESADWLLHEDVKATIGQSLHLPLAEQVKKVPVLIEKGIAQSKLGNKLNVSFSDFILTPHELVVNNQEIQLLVKIEGDFDLTLDLLKPHL
ncbi:MAG: DUF4403 family protein [Flammeovirgaceae bacterium]